MVLILDASTRHWHLVAFGGTVAGASAPAGVFHEDASLQLDVGVVMDRRLRRERRDRFEASTRLSANLQEMLGFARLDLVVLNDAPPTFARRVVLDGRRVYCRDAEGDHAFVRAVQLRAADLEPFLRRTQEVKLAALAPR